MWTRLFLIVALAAAIPLGALAQAPAIEAFNAAMERMMADMHMAPTGDADRDFATMMIPHHQGAIDMARVELEYGDDPALRALAAEIIEAQEKEIAVLKAWLEKNP